MIGLVWFRSDLRVRDNTALYEARREADELVGAFVVCPEQWREHDWGAVKVDFVLRNVAELGRSLATRGIPLRVRVARSFAEVPRVLVELAREERCDALFYNREYEVNELARDRRVEAALREIGRAVRAFDDQTVLPPGRLRTGAGAFYRVFTPYRRAWLDELHRTSLPRPVPAPEPREATRLTSDPIPESGFTASPVPASTWPAGEREALRRLDRFVERRIERYDSQRDLPAVEGTSTLSPYLACGVLSPRQCLATVADAHQGSIDAAGAGVASWISELVWREFYRHVLVGFPRVCRNRAFKTETDRLPWRDGGAGFLRWCEGRTGVPIVDAAMRQLGRTGFMHNRGRMIVAMYLTKDLFIDWRQGERYFMRHLVDGDFANNNGGWQWCASTGTDAAPYFRVFNPVSQSERYDPHGEFIRTFCPELAALDDKAIHDPSRLPAARRAALDYPEPLVDHAEARRRTLMTWAERRRCGAGLLRFDPGGPTMKRHATEAAGVSALARSIAAGIPDELPEHPGHDPEIDHAPPRRLALTGPEKELALANALRYFPAHLHERLAPEFADELVRFGRIYMQRYRPADHAMTARPLDEYPARSRQAAAIMLMIQNNLDPAVAQHPHELITYGGNGTVFQNWAQYRLTMRYLSEMTDEQTLVLYSGHPLGLFPSHPDAPRLVVTCGMVVPNHSRPEDYERLAALGVTSYGQMTAGSFMYIGPQGIVHGTAITLLNAGRRYLGTTGEQGLLGKVFVSSGLGGMSGAQAKAAVIAGAIGVVAEINPKALRKRHEQGWLQEFETDLDRLLRRIERARAAREAVSIGFLGNVVDLWERLAREAVPIDLGSDQTSLHNPFGGGYYPVGLPLEQSNEMMRVDPQGFRERVRESLSRQVAAINALAREGMRFWDYGNAFLLEASRAGAAVTRPDGTFLYPSYVEDIMGPMCFDYGFGPFRWVCTSADARDLAATDRIAAGVLEELAGEAPPETREQLLDNLRWIREAERHRLVVGSQARILYSDEPGRKRIALAFNRAVREGVVSAPIVLGRDHHDVSGTDSPYRETANIRDGSNLCADMAVHNVIGDSFRGATWVSLHNGGGVGWGEAINGGFGLLIDGTAEAERRLRSMIAWDVTNGLARRAWARNPGARFAVGRAMAEAPGLAVTLPHEATPELVRRALDEAEQRGPK